MRWRIGLQLTLREVTAECHRLETAQRNLFKFVNLLEEKCWVEYNLATIFLRQTDLRFVYFFNGLLMLIDGKELI